MAVYMISYDLTKKSSEDYEELFKVLKSFPSYKKVLLSMWLVKSSLPIEDVYTKIKPFFANDDLIFINELPTTWKGYNTSVKNWLGTVR